MKITKLFKLSLITTMIISLGSTISVFKHSSQSQLTNLVSDVSKPRYSKTILGASSITYSQYLKDIENTKSLQGQAIPYNMSSYLGRPIDLSLDKTLHRFPFINSIKSAKIDIDKITTTSGFSIIDRKALYSYLGISYDHRFMAPEVMRYSNDSEFMYHLRNTNNSITIPLHVSDTSTKFSLNWAPGSLKIDDWIAKNIMEKAKITHDWSIFQTDFSNSFLTSINENRSIITNLTITSNNPLLMNQIKSKCDHHQVSDLFDFIEKHPQDISLKSQILTHAGFVTSKFIPPTQQLQASNINDYMGRLETKATQYINNFHTDDNGNINRLLEWSPQGLTAGNATKYSTIDKSMSWKDIYSDMMNHIETLNQYYDKCVEADRDYKILTETSSLIPDGINENNDSLLNKLKQNSDSWPTNNSFKDMILLLITDHQYQDVITKMATSFKNFINDPVFQIADWIFNSKFSFGTNDYANEIYLVSIKKMTTVTNPHSYIISAEEHIGSQLSNWSLVTMIVSPKDFHLLSSKYELKTNLSTKLFTPDMVTIQSTIMHKTLIFSIAKDALVKVGTTYQIEAQSLAPNNDHLKIQTYILNDPNCYHFYGS